MTEPQFPKALLTRVYLGGNNDRYRNHLIQIIEDFWRRRRLPLRTYHNLINEVNAGFYQIRKLVQDETFRHSPINNLVGFIDRIELMRQQIYDKVIQGLWSHCQLTKNDIRDIDQYCHRFSRCELPCRPSKLSKKCKY